MKCSQCRQLNKELDTKWERLKNFLFNWLFTSDIADLKQDFYTRGFGDGYRKGRDHQYYDDKRIAAELWNVTI